MQHFPTLSIAGFKGILLLKGKRMGWEGEGRKMRRGQGRQKGEGGAWGGERRRGEWIEEINLPHGRLVTLAALVNLGN